MGTRVLTSTPSTWSQFAKAAWDVIPVPGRSARAGEPELETLRVRLEGVRIDPGRLARYRDVCGFDRGPRVPATYPHVIAFPLHLALLTDRRFPFPAVGTVHLANRIRTTGAIDPGSVVSVEVRAEDLVAHPRGRRITLRTDVRTGGEPVWTSWTYLLRRDRSTSAGSTAAGSTINPVAESVAEPVAEPSAVPAEAPSGPIRWQLRGSLGRRYARVSGDYNPIHLSDLTSLPFGFGHHIAHGMWSKARCLAELGHRLRDAIDVSVEFRKPVPLPGQVSFGARYDGDLVDFGLSPVPPGRTPHLVGRVQTFNESGRT